MATGLPIIPETITVHLGDPDQPAQNVTLPFMDYIMNVASSEIYPTWPEEAIRANIYAQISFALNRVYTEYYRSRGYDFDITNSTRFDQYFVNGRDIFENIQEIVGDIFNDYIRRQGSIEPLFAQYCNGTTVTCSGLSQWGSVSLAEAGYTPYRILQNYYGAAWEPVYRYILSMHERALRQHSGIYSYSPTIFGYEMMDLESTNAFRADYAKWLSLFDEADDVLCVGVGLGDLVEGLFCEALSVHVRHSFGVVFAAVGRICAFTDGEKCGIIQTNERGDRPCRKAIIRRAESWRSATS